MKRCKICEKPIPDEASYCQHCGAQVSADGSEEWVAPPPPAPKEIENLPPDKVRQYPDGKYRWTFKVNMYKNPTIFLLVFKIFGYIILGFWIFFNFINLLSGDLVDQFWFTTKIALIMFGIFTVLCILGYLLMALIYGGKYIVDFVMDENGVEHKQVKTQAKKAKIIGWLTILAGLAGGSRGAVSAGVASSSVNSSYSTFGKVRKVKGYRRRNLIKVNELLNKNQIYVRDDDFDFVYDYITTRCPQAKKS